MTWDSTLNFNSIYLCGILLLLLTSIPQAIEAGAGLGGVVVSFMLIGLGIGGIKSSVAPFTGTHSVNSPFNDQSLITIDLQSRSIARKWEIYLNSLEWGTCHRGS